MEKLQQWWRLRFSFRNATIVVCIFNLVTLLLLLQGFLSASYARKLATNHPSSGSSLTLSLFIHVVRLQHIKESEEIRRAMEPLELIKRVREIEKEARVESVPVQHKDTKQTAAVDLMSRLNNFRSSTDAASLKGKLAVPIDLSPNKNLVDKLASEVFANFTFMLLSLPELHVMLDVGK
ncbi:hypothetical protein RJ640_010549 [Escallonia rubra]|uniref:Uncharacterized protein n=1 Tax=Escallonia rubra TaxID=112253 RepID=A0AA88QCU6_9ASTE|nr:hypothetical protein RJ640_010549 [Escallonia rubra]